MTYIPKKYKIISIKKYTNDIKLFKVESDINPLPGQFVEVSIPGIGECPLASCSFEKNTLDLLTRNAGNVTSAIFNLKTGDNIYIRGPYGNGFPIEKLKRKNLLLIAGGTGIAPVTSLIGYIEKNKHEFKEVKIYFGFRSKDYILLKEKIKIWSKMFNVSITLENNLDKTKSNEHCNIGYVQDHIKDIQKKDTITILCGPEIMMKCVTDKLVSMNLDEKDIYWSMERRMECGFGSCARCLIQDVYVCKDGPIFQYKFIKERIANEEASNKWTI